MTQSDGGKEIHKFVKEPDVPAILLQDFCDCCLEPSLDCSHDVATNSVRRCLGTIDDGFSKRECGGANWDMGSGLTWRLERGFTGMGWGVSPMPRCTIVLGAQVHLHVLTCFCRSAVCF